MSLKKRLARAYRALTGAPRPPHAPPTQIQPDITRYYYLGPDLALTRLKNGHHLYVDPVDETMSAHMIAHGYWESWVYAVVMSLISPKDRIVEVGANLGYYTIAMAASTGPDGFVTTFEANPRLTALIQKSAYLNGFADRVKIIQKAATDRAGRVQFEMSRKRSGWGFVSIGGQTAHDDSVLVDVETTTLDAEVTGKVDFIRMDAEGSEALILKGAERILTENPDVIICMEWAVVQIASRTSVPDFIDWMSRLGFRFWRIGYDSGLTEIPAANMSSLDPCDVIAARKPPL